MWIYKENSLLLLNQARLACMDIRVCLVFCVQKQPDEPAAWQSFGGTG